MPVRIISPAKTNLGPVGLGAKTTLNLEAFVLIFHQFHCLWAEGHLGHPPQCYYSLVICPNNHQPPTTIVHSFLDPSHLGPRRGQDHGSKQRNSAEDAERTVVLFAKFAIATDRPLTNSLRYINVRLFFHVSAREKQRLVC